MADSVKPGGGSNLMSGSLFAQGLLGIGSGYSQYVLQQAQGEFQKSQFLINRKILNLQAADVLEQGEEAVATHRGEVNKLLSAQKASYASQGIDVTSGVAREVAESTKLLAALDQIKIKNNAWQEAWGLRLQGIGSQGQANLASISSRNAATNSLLTGGIGALSSFGQAGYYYQGSKAPVKTG